MKIILTVKEMLDLARSCLQGGCSGCALNDACHGYDDLEKLCRIENQISDIAMKSADVPVIIPKEESCVLDGEPPKNGGVMRSTDELVDDIISASAKPKPENKNKIAAEDKRRIRKLLSNAVAEHGDEVVEEMLQAANGTIVKGEILGMLSGMKLPIDLWRIAEQALYDAGYVGY